jgi:hypothetical protein
MLLDSKSTSPIAFFLLFDYLNKSISNINLEEEKDNISLSFYLFKRKYKFNINKLWDSPSNMIKVFTYAYLIYKGYLLIPISNGWLCVNTKEEYQLPANLSSCTCYSFSKSKAPCIHILMAQGYLHLNQLSSQYLMSRKL